MALNLTKPKRKFLTNPSLIHLFSTSSTSPPPQNETESIENQQSPDSKIPLYLNNIRSSLKQNPSQSSDLQSVRKNLNEFRRKQTQSSSSSSSSSSAIGLTDLYNEEKASLNSRDGLRKADIYGNIKENLRQMRSSLSRNVVESNWKSSFKSERSRGSESFVKSNVIGLGMKSSVSGDEKNELFRKYNDEELGEKLRMFRPEGEKKEEGWFTFKELNERLVKLREVEEEEAAKRMKEGGGLRFQELRDGLQQVKDEEAKKHRACMFSTL